MTYDHSEVFKVLKDVVQELVTEQRQNENSWLWRLSGRQKQLNTASWAVAHVAEKLADIAFAKAEASHPDKIGG